MVSIDVEEQRRMISLTMNSATRTLLTSQVHGQDVEEQRREVLRLWRIIYVQVEARTKNVPMDVRVLLFILLLIIRHVFEGHYRV
jgi:hypothetical protein